MAKHCINDILRTSAIPLNEARILMSKISGLTHAQLLTADYERLPEKIQVAFKKAIERRQQGEPIAYIINERDFYGRTFYVNPNVLIPRHETEHLVEAVLDRLPEHSTAHVWDLGTGSGIIAITLKCERKNIQVWASDISPLALQVAQKNSEIHQLDIHFLLGDWWHIIPPYTPPKPHSLDIIVSNPPYIHNADPHLHQGDLNFEPRLALTDNHDGLNALASIIHGAKGYLKNGGYLYCEHGYNQASDIHNLFKQHGFSNIKTIQDYAQLDRVSYAQFLL